MLIQRDQYVNELLSKRWNGKVKIITGIRRCGKSFLLSTLYKNFVKDKHLENVLAHLFKVDIKGDDSWIIVREFPNSKSIIHSITDSDAMARAAIKKSR